ncbi:MAG TPA: chitosanase [Thermoanaerobaculia bacterium]|nr:chitosanase [Thermoanaerobaculia bacterium]
MNLTPAQKRIIEQVVNVFETGRPEGDYGATTILNDGPHGIRQLTYGRSQTTEYGKLRVLVLSYAEAGGTYSRDLARYADRIGAVPLADDRQFRSLLRTAGRHDPVMRAVQDAFFEQEFFLPAMAWATAHGLTLPLSALVVYDSFIHSGSILPLIRRSFPDPTPTHGGEERAWTTAYVKARDAWLASHPRADVRRTVYRTQCLSALIQADNWHLAMRPIRVRGVRVG